ncbi:MAG: hypothetical protein M3Q48_00565, partial [Actinomycetota bacterium]|nr:hypothetical protein [Actinomycetota bacterium]
MVRPHLGRAGGSTGEVTGASSAPLLLGLDVGTSRIKALLIDEAGRDVALAVVATPFRDRAGAVEMGVDDLGDAVARVLADLGTARARVAGVGVAG